MADTHFKDWKVDCIEEKEHAAGTVNRNLNAIRGVVSYAVESDLLAAHPMKKIKKMREPSGIERFLNDA